MTEPSRFAGQRSQPARFHRQGRAWRFLGKIILAALRYFSRKPCLWRRTARRPPKTGMAFPLKHEDYESKRTHQKDSGQQMGKNPRAGRHGSRHFQLALYTRHISRMDCRSHHLFQGILQVPLPCSLPARGTGHPPVHPEFSGLLKSDSMEHTRILSLQHKGAVRKRAALFISVTPGNDTPEREKGRKTQTLALRRTTGQSWQTLLVGRQGQAASGFGKNHPRRRLRYFSRKPCLSGNVCRWALVVQRAAKARVFTLKK